MHYGVFYCHALSLRHALTTQDADCLQGSNSAGVIIVICSKEYVMLRFVGLSLQNYFYRHEPSLQIDLR